MAKTLKRISNATIRKRIVMLEKKKKANEERKELLMKLRKLKGQTTKESTLKKAGKKLLTQLRGLNVEF